MLLLAFAVGVAVMGKARSLEAKLARLKQLRDVPHSAEVAGELRAWVTLSALWSPRRRNW